MPLCKIIQKNWLKLRNFRLLQPTFPKLKQPVENYTGYQFPEQISKREIQDVNTRNNKNLPPDRRMGNIHRLQGCLLPHTNPGSTYIITSRVSPTNSKHYLLACPQLPWSSLLFTEGGQTNGFTQGYKNLPRRLVGQSQIPPSLSPEYTKTSSSVRSCIGW